MSSVFESYEHQFSTITADITARIGKIPNLTGSMCNQSFPSPRVITYVISVAEKKTAIGVVQGNMDEAGELVSIKQI